MAITPAAVVEVTTATDDVLLMRALSGPVQGRDFPIVWVCTEDEFARAQAAHEDPHRIPWPVNAVKELQPQ